jgi:hypothetical protein
VVCSSCGEETAVLPIDDQKEVMGHPNFPLLLLILNNQMSVRIKRRRKTAHVAPKTIICRILYISDPLLNDLLIFSNGLQCSLLTLQKSSQNLPHG